jgi:flagellin-like protein
MKILKSRKALSPVVASIILIAVTVAVSIAVAAWMGALTFTFTKTEELAITAMTFSGTSGSANNTIVLTVKNTGTSAVTVSAVYINDASKSFATSGSFTSSNQLAAGASGTITVYMGSGYWSTGNKYRVVIQSSTGKNVASYEKVA